MAEQNTVSMIELAVEIVSAYVSNNTVPAAELPQIIREVHMALTGLGSATAHAQPDAPRPAVPPKKSVFDDHLVCLEDGKKFKSLKRHLRSQYNMTPAQYRDKWGLPPDYPMVAPNYARARSRLAREMGLGQQRGKD